MWYTHGAATEELEGAAELEGVSERLLRPAKAMLDELGEALGVTETETELDGVEEAPNGGKAAAQPMRLTMARPVNFMFYCEIGVSFVCF